MEQRKQARDAQSNLGAPAEASARAPQSTGTLLQLHLVQETESVREVMQIMHHMQESIVKSESKFCLPCHPPKASMLESKREQELNTIEIPHIP